MSAPANEVNSNVSTEGPSQLSQPSSSGGPEVTGEKKVKTEKELEKERKKAEKTKKFAEKQNALKQAGFDGASKTKEKKAKQNESKEQPLPEYVEETPMSDSAQHDCPDSGGQGRG